MSLRFSASFDGPQVVALDRLMDRLDDNMRDLDQAGAWQAASDVLSEEFEELFDSEGAHGGPRWSRLSPVTVERREDRNLTPIKIGWATGRMATSLIEPTHPDAIEIRSPLEMVRGTGASHEGVGYPSVFAQGRAGQPARPIIGRLFRSGNTRSANRLWDAIEGAVFGPVDE